MMTERKRYVRGMARHTRRGASSVLVIFMMIILVVLGALAFTASYAHLKLSNKTSASYGDMYAVDALGERTLARVDAALAYAELDARAYMRNNVFAMPSGGPLSSEAQNAVHSAYTAIAREDGSLEGFSKALFERLFYHFAEQRLTEASDALGLEIIPGVDLEGAFAYSYNAVFPDEVLTAVINISMGEEPGARQLTAHVSVICPVYAFAFEDGAITAQREDNASTARTEIAQWRQWQIPFEYSDGYEFDSTLDEDAWGE